MPKENTLGRKREMLVEGTCQVNDIVIGQWNDTTMSQRQQTEKNLSHFEVCKKESGTGKRTIIELCKNVIFSEYKTSFECSKTTISENWKKYNLVDNMVKSHKQRVTMLIVCSLTADILMFRV